MADTDQIIAEANNTANAIVADAGQTATAIVANAEQRADQIEAQSVTTTVQAAETAVALANANAARTIANVDEDISWVKGEAARLTTEMEAIRQTQGEANSLLSTMGAQLLAITEALAALTQTAENPERPIAENPENGADGNPEPERKPRKHRLL